jgi:HEAT repeat protein
VSDSEEEEIIKVVDDGPQPAPEPKSAEELIGRIVAFYQAETDWQSTWIHHENWPKDLDPFDFTAEWTLARSGDRLALKKVSPGTPDLHIVSDGQTRQIGYADRYQFVSGPAPETWQALLKDRELGVSAGEQRLLILDYVSAPTVEAFCEGFTQLNYLGRKTENGSAVFHLRLAEGEHVRELWIAAVETPRILRLEETLPVSKVSPGSIGRKRLGPAKFVVTREATSGWTFAAPEPGTLRLPSEFPSQPIVSFSLELDRWTPSPLLHHPLPVAQPMPATDGSKTSISSLLGKTTLWLCIHPEAPDAAAYAAALRRVHVDFWQRDVQVAVVMLRARREDAVEWLRTSGLDRFPSFLANNRHEADWHVTAIPMVILTDPSGTVRRIRSDSARTIEVQLQRDLAAMADRVAAVERLVGEIRDDLRPDWLVEQLGHDDPAVVQAAQTRLVQLGGTAVFAVAEGLNDSREAVRVKSAELFPHFGQSAAGALPALIEALNDDSAAVRLQASVNLAGLGETALGPLIGSLESSTPRVRGGAARALGLMGPKGSAAAAALVHRLADSDPFVRQEVSEALVKMGPEVLSAITAALLASDPTVHTTARSILVAFGPQAVPHLIQALESDAPHVAEQVTLAADALGAESQARLREALRVREMVAQLPKLPTQSVVARLVQGDAAMLKAAKAELAKRGESVVPILIETLSADQPTARAAAADALRELGETGHAAIPAIVQGLGDPSAGVRRVFGETLASFGQPALDVMLETWKNEPSSAVQEGIVEAFAQFGAEAERALPVLSEAMKTGSSKLRESAGKALAQLGPAGIAALVRALESDESMVYEAAGQALSTAPATAVPTLVGLLTHEKNHVRIWAATALGTMGPKANGSLVALKKMFAEDPDRGVRSYAEWAIRKIDR